MTAALDPRWEWIEAPRKIGDAEPQMIRGRCNHLPEYVVPVESGGVIVAALCLTCDAQLDASVETTHTVPISRSV